MVSVAFSLPGLPGVSASSPLPAAPLPQPVEPSDITLRVSGGKPLRMRGVMLAEATSWAPSIPAWHEVALYRTADGDCALAVRMLKKSSGETDIHHAEIFKTMEDALSWLEQFDPTADLAPEFDASDRRISTVDIALMAAALRQKADAVTRQWRGLLGELLYRFALPA
ncbi:hypothetical protein HB662_05575 [Roseomonas frigidaquae]|uniref:Uncharacterized protein n=1 Tax=Falsiroseomonas frigidaquae TaxID=487318 RepID=A0ABX1EUH6_9PROT|nr:hypothetical protein [Falsiroseomonas frigidaquae]NKE44237.1 hypothetical protein [Falsiroseomonas frigidaquae]